mgnify:CR=1 FL=1
MNAKNMMKSGMNAAKKYGNKGEDLRKMAFKEHKCFWGGGDQGTLSLRACDGPAPHEKKYRSGGLVTKGSKKEKSRLSGKFRVV